MTFQELKRSLLLREDYGTVKTREAIEKEIWNCALDAIREKFSWEIDEYGREEFIAAIRELKV